MLFKLQMSVSNVSQIPWAYIHNVPTLFMLFLPPRAQGIKLHRQITHSWKLHCNTKKRNKNRTESTQRSTFGWHLFSSSFFFQRLWSASETIIAFDNVLPPAAGGVSSRQKFLIKTALDLSDGADKRKSWVGLPRLPAVTLLQGAGSQRRAHHREPLTTLLWIHRVVTPEGPIPG